MEKFKLKKNIKITRTTKLYELPLKYLSKNSKFEEGTVSCNKKIMRKYISLLNEDTSIFPSGTKVNFRAMISKKERALKKNGSPYIYIEVNDGEGVIGSPIWTNNFRVYESGNITLKDFDDLSIGDVVDISGDLSFFDEKPQVQNPEFTVIKELSKVDYLDKYEIDFEFELLLKIINELPEHYSRFAKRALGLDGDIEKWVKFMIAPAAKSHHHAKLGGLFLHTLGVATNIISIRDSYDDKFHYARAALKGSIASDKINYDRLILTAILHDFMKIEDYSSLNNFVTMMNHIKENESFIEEEYEENDKHNKCDHIPRGVAYIHEINKELDNILSKEEVDSICYSMLSHHGQWSPYSPKSIEDLLLHLADMIDSKIYKFNETGAI